MFAYIKGNLEIKSNDYIVIDVMGIGYKIYMSPSAIDTLGETGQTIKVHTHYHVREDNISLYGFKTLEELRMFELLISTSGIGAKSAITILSNITPSSFALAIISNDTSKLVKIPGIGAKTAARIVLELKDKLKETEKLNSETSEIKEAIVDNEKIEEAKSALQVLGYTSKEITKVIEKMNTSGLSVEDIIKNGLQLLAG